MAQTHHASLSPALQAALPKALRSRLRTSNFFLDFFLEEHTLGLGAHGKILQCRPKRPDVVATTTPTTPTTPTTTTTTTTPTMATPTTTTTTTTTAATTTPAFSTHKKYAVKAVPCSLDALHTLNLQLSLCPHPHILDVEAVYCNELTREHCPFLKYNPQLRPGLHLLIVMPLMAGGDLFSQVTSSTGWARMMGSEENVAAVLRQVAVGLAYIHERGLVHGDMKLENVLCRAAAESARQAEPYSSSDEESHDPDSHPSPMYATQTMHGRSAAAGMLHVFITDFEFAHAAGEAPKFNCFTKAYASPEILANVERQENGEQLAPVGACADVWALGVMLYIMLVRQLPFYSQPSEESGQGKDALTLYWRSCVKAGTFACGPLERAVSPAARDLLRKMLHPRASSRLTIHEVLQHPFVTRTTAPVGLTRTAVASPHVSAQDMPVARKPATRVPSCRDDAVAAGSKVPLESVAPRVRH